MSAPCPRGENSFLWGLSCSSSLVCTSGGELGVWGASNLLGSGGKTPLLEILPRPAGALKKEHCSRSLRLGFWSKLCHYLV